MYVAEKLDFNPNKISEIGKNIENLTFKRTKLSSEEDE